MQLKESGYLMRFYLFNASWREREDTLNHGVSLCSLFWTVLFRLALSAAGVFTAGMLLALYITESILQPFKWIAVPLIAVSVGFLLSMLVEGVGEAVNVVNRSTAVQFIKGRFCPIIKVEADE